MGGEESLFLFPNTDGAEGSRLPSGCERPLGSAESSRALQVIAPTLTIGLAAGTASDGLEALLARADRALYRGKAGGRNRAVLTSSPEDAADARGADDDVLLDP